MDRSEKLAKTTKTKKKAQDSTSDIEKHRSENPVSTTVEQPT
jgi:hypothetical protein